MAFSQMKFHQKILLAALMLLGHCHAGAQVITGVVCDIATRQPVADVRVYLDGTSIGTFTNASGKFELRTMAVVNTKLVLHHLSYKIAIVDHPFAGIPDTLYIEERVRVMHEVVVQADRFTREQKVKAFREQFLGMTRAGKSSTILNEDDIRLVVDMQKRRLLASSEKPIVVANDFLGYKVFFTLVDFWAQYGFSMVSLDSRYVQHSFFAVTSSFTDMAPDSKRVKRRRDNVYKKSSGYFFKSLASDSLTENRFMIFNKMQPVNPGDYFAVKDTLSQKMVSIIPNTDISKEKAFYAGPKLSGVVSVLYRRAVQSDIYFMTDSFLVDRYGNVSAFDKITFSGQMGKHRAGNMLPVDYE
jgi:hypothetical protein